MATQRAGSRPGREPARSLLRDASNASAAQQAALELARSCAQVSVRHSSLSCRHFAHSAVRVPGPARRSNPGQGNGRSRPTASPKISHPRRRSVPTPPPAVLCRDCSSSRPMRRFALPSLLCLLAIAGPAWPASRPATATGDGSDARRSPRGGRPAASRRTRAIACRWRAAASTSASTSSAASRRCAPPTPASTARRPPGAMLPALSFGLRSVSVRGAGEQPGRSDARLGRGWCRP